MLRGAAEPAGAQETIAHCVDNAARQGNADTSDIAVSDVHVTIGKKGPLDRLASGR